LSHVSEPKVNDTALATSNKAVGADAKQRRRRGDKPYQLAKNIRDQG